jgi:uncharacterized membrane protein YfcA
MTVVGLVLAALIGLSLGIMGAGGSILTVPIFVYILGFGTKEAIASSLAVVGVTSLFGALEHWREEHLELRLALVFGAFAMVGAYLGARVAFFFSGAAQLALFALAMLVAAFFMLRNGRPGKDEEYSHYRDDDIRWMAFRLAATGLGVGILTGLVGVGGGFLIVPALVLLAKVRIKVAVGTSLPVIAMNSAAGFTGYLGNVEVQWALVAAFAALAVGGSFAGTYLARLFSGEVLQRDFAIFLILMAVFILYQNQAVLPFG